MNKTLEKRHVIWHLGASIFFLSKVFSLPGKLRNISMCQKINIILGTKLTIKSFWQLFLQHTLRLLSSKKKENISVFLKTYLWKGCKVWLKTTTTIDGTHDVAHKVTHVKVWKLRIYSFYKNYVKLTFLLSKLLELISRII